MKNSARVGILLLSILLSLAVGVAFAEKTTMSKSNVNMSITVPQNVALNLIVPQNATVNIIRYNLTQITDLTAPASMTNVTKSMNNTSLQPNQVQSGINRRKHTSPLGH